MKISIIGPVAPTGYGVVTSHLVWALSKVASVCLEPMGPMDTSWFSPKVAAACEAATVTKFQPDYTLCIWHEWDHPPKGRDLVMDRYIAMPTFELDRVRPEAIQVLRECHRVLVSSRWCERVLTNQSLTNVHMEHFHGVDREIFNEINLPKHDPEGPFRILTLGKLEYRKGHDLVIQLLAYLISHHFNVQLWAMWTNPFLHPQMHRDMLDGWIRNAAAEHGVEQQDIRDAIFEIGFKKTPQEVAAIIKTCHYGLFPYRAEGWNLPLLETMSCGLEVGATFATGPLDYLYGGNADLFRSNRVEAHDGIWFGPGRATGYWFEPEYNQIITMVTSALRSFQLGQLGINERGVETAKELTWEAAGLRIVKWLDRGCPLSS